MGLDDPYIAFCLDDATYTWGVFVEAKLKEAQESGDKPAQRKAARERMWKRIFEGGTAQAKGVFRDPAEMFKK